MNGIANEESVTSSHAGEAQQEQASQMGHGHVNSIRSILGLDQEHSLLGRLTAHTRRKLAELRAIQASKLDASGSNAPNWSDSMKPEPFGHGFIKTNRKPFLISVGCFTLMAFWLFVIRSVHHTEDPNHLASNEKWAQQIASSTPTVEKPPEIQPQVEVSGDVPASFGSPNPVGYQPAAVPQTPIGYPQAASTPQMPQSAAAPQMFSPYPSMYAPPTPGYGARVPASNFSMQQQPGLIPVREHAAARYKVVVSR